MTSKEVVKKGIWKATGKEVEFDDFNEDDEPIVGEQIDDENTDREEPEDD